MSEPQFFQTRMGQRFYEHTMPELVRAVERLNENLERLAAATERASQSRDPDDEAAR